MWSSCGSAELRERSARALHWPPPRVPAAPRPSEPRGPHAGRGDRPPLRGLHALSVCIAAQRDLRWCLDYSASLQCAPHYSRFRKGLHRFCRSIYQILKKVYIYSAEGYLHFECLHHRVRSRLYTFRRSPS